MDSISNSIDHTTQQYTQPTKETTLKSIPSPHAPSSDNRSLASYISPQGNSCGYFYDPQTDSYFINIDLLSTLFPVEESASSDEQDKNLSKEIHAFISEHPERTIELSTLINKKNLHSHKEKILQKLLSFPKDRAELLETTVRQLIVDLDIKETMDIAQHDYLAASSLGTKKNTYYKIDLFGKNTTDATEFTKKIMEELLNKDKEIKVDLLKPTNLEDKLAFHRIIISKDNESLHQELSINLLIPTLEMDKDLEETFRNNPIELALTIIHGFSLKSEPLTTSESKIVKGNIDFLKSMINYNLVTEKQKEHLSSFEKTLLRKERQKIIGKRRETLRNPNNPINKGPETAKVRYDIIKKECIPYCDLADTKNTEIPSDTLDRFEDLINSGINNFEDGIIHTLSIGKKPLEDHKEEELKKIIRNCLTMLHYANMSMIFQMTTFSQESNQIQSLSKNIDLINLSLLRLDPLLQKESYNKDENTSFKHELFKLKNYKDSFYTIQKCYSGYRAIKDVDYIPTYQTPKSDNEIFRKTNLLNLFDIIHLSNDRSIENHEHIASEKLALFIKDTGSIKMIESKEELEERYHIIEIFQKTIFQNPTLMEHLKNAIRTPKLLPEKNKISKDIKKTLIDAHSKYKDNSQKAVMIKKKKHRKKTRTTNPKTVYTEEKESIEIESKTKLETKTKSFNNIPELNKFIHERKPKEIITDCISFFQSNQDVENIPSGSNYAFSDFLCRGLEIILEDIAKHTDIVIGQNQWMSRKMEIKEFDFPENMSECKASLQYFSEQLESITPLITESESILQSIPITSEAELEHADLCERQTYLRVKEAKEAITKIRNKLSSSLSNVKRLKRTADQFFPQIPREKRAPKNPKKHAIPIRVLLNQSVRALENTKQELGLSNISWDESVLSDEADRTKIKKIIQP